MNEQLDRLRTLLDKILPDNRFYAAKFASAGATSLDTLEDLTRLPFTTKQELSLDQARCPPYGQVLTYPRERYTRLCQTSGTEGQPLRWLDTPQSWQWMLDCWKSFYRIAGIKAGDRLFFAFSFGPFLGFWTAFESACQLGCLCLPGGGMSSTARLRFLMDNAADVVLCTPTYALHLAEAARRDGIELRSGPVRKLIVAGEPGGSIATMRGRMEQAWDAVVFDHHGMTEIGPVSIECQHNPAGLHVLESDYIMEVLDLKTEQPVPPGRMGELVLTNFGRTGSPLIRYKTGDLVVVDPKPCPCGLPYRRLKGGILGRADDMINIRGNSVFPAALEETLRQWPEIVEFRVQAQHSAELTALRIDIEPRTADQGNALAEKVQEAIRAQYLFRPDVTVVPPGTLPRFEMKAKRFHRHN